MVIPGSAVLAPTSLRSPRYEHGSELVDEIENETFAVALVARAYPVPAIVTPGLSASALTSPLADTEAVAGAALLTQRTESAVTEAPVASDRLSVSWTVLHLAIAPPRGLIEAVSTTFGDVEPLHAKLPQRMNAARMKACPCVIGTTPRN